MECRWPINEYDDTDGIHSKTSALPFNITIYGDNLWAHSKDPFYGNIFIHTYCTIINC